MPKKNTGRLQVRYENARSYNEGLAVDFLTSDFFFVRRTDMVKKSTNKWQNGRQIVGKAI